MIVYEYVIAENGTVHLARQSDLATKRGDAKAPSREQAKTLCGRRVAGWTMGDETIACIEATCLVCRRIARPELR